MLARASKWFSDKNRSLWVPKPCTRYRGVFLLPCSFKLKTCTNKPTLLCKVSGCAVLLQETWKTPRNIYFEVKSTFHSPIGSKIAYFGNRWTGRFWVIDFDEISGETIYFWFARTKLLTQEMLTLLGIVLRRWNGLKRCQTLDIAIIGNLRRSPRGPPKYGTYVTTTPV